MSTAAQPVPARSPLVPSSKVSGQAAHQASPLLTEVSDAIGRLNGQISDTASRLLNHMDEIFGPQPSPATGGSQGVNPTTRESQVFAQLKSLETTLDFLRSQVSRVERL